MAEKVAEGHRNPEGMPVSAIFSVDGLVTPEHRSAVVSRVLGEFSALPRGAQNALRQAVNEDVVPATGGFRRGQAGRALGTSSFLLQDPVEQAIPASNELSVAVLRCWAESHPSLREAIERHLAGKGADFSAPELSEKHFRGTWSREQWRSEQTSFSEVYEGFEPDDVALMLCFIAGRFPVSPEEAPDRQDADGNALTAALSYLRQLPPTSGQWEREIPDFAATVSRIMEEKAAQLRWAADFDAIAVSLKAEFLGMLQFFETDTEGWAAESVSPDADTSSILALAQNLQSLLREYQPVHERAPGISEERERSSRRA